MVVSERWKTVRACKRQRGGGEEGGQSWVATPHPKDPIPLYLLEGTAQALLTVQVIVNNLCKVKRRRHCEHHREQHRESQSVEHGSPEPPPSRVREH